MKALLTFFMIFVRAALILNLAALFSCSTPTETLKIGPYYRMNMKIENVGANFKGLAVLVDKPLYTFNLESAGSMDYLSFNSCSSTITSVDAGGIFNKKKAKINFRPNELEKEDNCDIRIDVINKKQKHTFGYILFQNPKFKSNATVICGSDTREIEGVAGCQLLAGNKMRIKFNKETFAVSNCEIKEKSKNFDIIVKPGFCNYYFSNEGKKFRLMNYGWTEENLN